MSINIKKSQSIIGSIYQENLLSYYKYPVTNLSALMDMLRSGQYDSVYMFGNGIIEACSKDKKSGIYADETQILILVEDDGQVPISEILKCIFCQYSSETESGESSLRVLDIRFFKEIQVDLHFLKNLEILRLNKIEYVEWNWYELEELRKLKILDLDRTDVKKIPEIRYWENLEELYLRYTKITELNITEPHQTLRCLSLSGTQIRDITFLKYMPSLVRFSMRRTAVSHFPKSGDWPENLIYMAVSHSVFSGTEGWILPDFSHLTNLRVMDLNSAELKEIPENHLPPNVKFLTLYGNRKLRKLPESIGNLKKLEVMDLRMLNLDTLPSALLELNLPFILSNISRKITSGILLHGTKVYDMDISILEQSPAVAREWFANRNLETEQEQNLNEIKVIFLGDGGAGKSLSIARLLKDGEMPTDFQGDSTPGIAISNQICQMDGKNITIHYWDFGGQEIMHSMHCMFLTKRTVYVVFVNVRDNNQDERAFYWLHNIRNFANESPVLLVLNQIDQNPGASVNETGLRRLYPSLKDVIRLSALTDSREEFQKKLYGRICAMIPSMEMVRDSFLSSWIRLKERLTDMQEYYIDTPAFEKMCRDCNVSEKEDVRNGLIERFHDLGISFCYKERGLSRYMILKPEWITNAIYILLFNGLSQGTDGKPYARNGILKIDAIHELLERRVPVKSVLDISYKEHEVAYVLGVIRKFRLSYQVDAEHEFFPMLCDKNEREIVEEYVDQEEPLEYYFEYEYLPINVFHRLRVELHQYLNREEVWLTGALFESSSMHISALVRMVNNRIYIYARSQSKIYPASTMLELLRENLERINHIYGLEPELFLVYKERGKKEAIDYQMLLESYKYGNTTYFSRVFRRNLDIEMILRNGGREEGKERKKLVNAVIRACQKMQANKKYWDASEVERNICVRDLLENEIYIAADGGSSGKSGTGVKEGILDILISSRKNGKPLAIYEALNLKNLNESSKKYWLKHLHKLVDNYNPTGLPCLFLVSYVECSKSEFGDFKTDFRNFIQENEQTECDLRENLTEWKVEEFFTQCIECQYDFDGMPVTVYHINVRMGD